MCRECDITRLFVRSEVGDVPLVQTLQGLVVEAVLTDIIQQVDEICVALAVDMCQLNTEIIALSADSIHHVWRQELIVVRLL